jgi:hypothetical protein
MAEDATRWIQTGLAQRIKNGRALVAQFIRQNMIEEITLPTGEGRELNSGCGNKVADSMPTYRRINPFRLLELGQK